jgi:hypothetical protein
MLKRLINSHIVELPKFEAENDCAKYFNEQEFISLVENNEIKFTTFSFNKRKTTYISSGGRFRLIVSQYSVVLLADGAPKEIINWYDVYTIVVRSMAFHLKCA